jgi:hypothetical protein
VWKVRSRFFDAAVRMCPAVPRTASNTRAMLLCVWSMSLRKNLCLVAMPLSLVGCKEAVPAQSDSAQVLSMTERALSAIRSHDGEAEASGFALLYEVLKHPESPPRYRQALADTLIVLATTMRNDIARSMALEVLSSTEASSGVPLATPDRLYFAFERQTSRGMQITAMSHLSENWDTAAAAAKLGLIIAAESTPETIALSAIEMLERMGPEGNLIAQRLLGEGSTYNPNVRVRLQGGQDRPELRPRY